MRRGQPSRTALGAAFHRAAHQVLERGAIFADPLAVRILADDADTAIRAAQADPSRRRLRLFIAARSRFAEDALAAAIPRGVSQLVVLGAGLDTFAYRTTLADRLLMFEVDHPATQAWKRQRLAATGIAVPRALRFAPVDFERETLAEALAAAGFAPRRPTLFTWLGVVPYLTEPAVLSTLAFIAGLPGGADVVFDYGNPPAPDDVADDAHARLAARVAAAGEAFRSLFETGALHARLAALGFSAIEDLGPADIRARWFPGHAGAAPERGGHIVHAMAARRR